MARYAVTRTFETEWTGEMKLPSHEVIEVTNLTEIAECANWQHLGRGVFSGNNGRAGLSGLVTFYARPLN